MSTVHERRLVGWKSIANHLDRCRRTVQRWHADYGLPIYQIGGERGHVFAYADEIEAWMRSHGSQTARELRNAQQNDDLAGSSSSQRNISVAHRISDSDRLHAVELVELALSKWRVLSNDDVQPIASLLRMAVDLNPFHAEALAWYAAVMLTQGFCGYQPTANLYRSAGSVLHQAAQIDPSSITVRTLTGWIYLLLDRNWHSASSVFEEVLLAAPQNKLALIGSATLYVAQKRLSKASEMFAMALEDNPLLVSAIGQSAWVDYLSENYGAAATKLTNARRSGCSGCLFDCVEALCLLQVENAGHALGHIEDLFKNSSNRAVLAGALGRAYCSAGFVAKARGMLAFLNKTEGPGMDHRSYASALVYVGLGESRKALESIEACFKRGLLWSFSLHCDPALAPLRNDPDFREFLSHVNYPTD